MIAKPAALIRPPATAVPDAEGILNAIAMAVVVATATKPEFEHAESRERLVQFLQARGLMGEDEQN